MPLGIFEYPEADAARRLVVEWVNAQARRYVQNDANITLEEFQLHLQPCMSDLVQFFYASLRSFIEAQGQDVPEIGITQCWLNVNRPGERHHRHHHPNSFISGVYYLDSSPDAGSIAFHRPGLLELEPARLRGTPFTFDIWKELPATGRLLLFPSRLEHSVEPNQSGRDRLSISFNTMFRGTIGSHLQRVDFGR
jgi:uncharacterized protein (TIGR02466 family)